MSATLHLDSIPADPRGPSDARGLWSRRAGGAALVVWFAAVVVLGGALLAKHLVPFRAPGRGASLAALGALRPAGARGRWLAVHVLSGDCRCSQRVAAHLANTQRPARWSEVVLWTGGVAPPGEFARHGLAVRVVSQDDLRRYGITAAPLLVALDPDGAVAYVGGYSDRKQGAALRDLETFAALERSAAAPALPVFGCAVSERLRGALAPLPSP